MTLSSQVAFNKTAVEENDAEIKSAQYNLEKINMEFKQAMHRLEANLHVSRKSSMIGRIIDKPITDVTYAGVNGTMYCRFSG